MAPRTPPRSPGPVPKGDEIRRRGSFGDVTGPLAETLEYSEGVNGPSASAQWIVEGIGGPPEFVLPIAVTAAGIPRVGDTYAALPQLPVSRVSAKLAPGSNTTAIVTVEWATRDAVGENAVVIEPGETVSEAQIEVNSTIRGGVTRFDVDGTPLIVEQEFEFDLSDEVAGFSQFEFRTIREWKEIEVNQSLHIVRFTRMERGNPDPIARRFLNHTNATVVFGDQPGMWLCTGLDGVSNDNGETYRVIYEFQRGLELEPTTEQTVVPNPVPVSQPGVPLLPATEPLLGWGTVIQLDGSFLFDDTLVSPILRLNEGIRAVRSYLRDDFRQIPGLDFGPLPDPVP